MFFHILNFHVINSWLLSYRVDLHFMGFRNGIRSKREKLPFCTQIICILYMRMQIVIFTMFSSKYKNQRMYMYMQNISDDRRITSLNGSLLSLLFNTRIRRGVYISSFGCMNITLMSGGEFHWLNVTNHVKYECWCKTKKKKSSLMRRHISTFLHQYWNERCFTRTEIFIFKRPICPYLLLLIAITSISFSATY